jgi:hypothetical protein
MGDRLAGHGGRDDRGSTRVLAPRSSPQPVLHDLLARPLVKDTMAPFVEEYGSRVGAGW